MKLFAILSAALLAGACFFPWVNIESKGIVITGVNTTGTNFGKPGYFHFLLTGLCLLFLLINKRATQKIAVFFAAFNLAWAIRNFSIISGCYMGECPEKQPALFLIVLASIFILIASLFWNKPGQK